MATGVEVMKNFFKVLKDFSYEDNNTGRAALDKATRAVWKDAYQFSNVFTNLKSKLFNASDERDSDTRLQELTGMIIGADGDLTVDTGSISGSNAGGSTVKDAQSIVPEDGDLSTATLPTPGSTSQITYTGDDGKSFTFNVKWPDSFTQFVSGRAVDSTTNMTARLFDSRFISDLNDFDDDKKFIEDFTIPLEAVLGAFSYGDTTYGDMKNAAPVILKGLNTYWLKEGAKLIYDSYGLDFDGKTIEIKFMAGGSYDNAAGITSSSSGYNFPSDKIVIGLNLVLYGKIDETNPNGLNNLQNQLNNDNIYGTEYLDRVVAHEMVHAAMYASGTLKDIGMPQFFIEGIADLIQGDDDYNSAQTSHLRNIVNDSDTFIKALNFEEAGGNNAYSAGDMLLRYMAKQASDTSIFVGDENSKNQTIDYNGGDMIITDYDESNTINYNANFQTAGLKSVCFNDLAINSGDNKELTLRDVRGKLITFNANNGAAYAYMAENAGEIDGKDFNDGNNYEILFGMNNKDNVIRAGNGGAQLWGGYLGNDELFGGAGVDVFVYESVGGNDTVHDAENQDTVLIKDISLDQITSAQFTDNGVSISFTYGGTLNVEGQPTIFVLEKDNVSYIADYQNKSWSQNE